MNIMNKLTLNEPAMTLEINSELHIVYEFQCGLLRFLCFALLSLESSSLLSASTMYDVSTASFIYTINYTFCFNVPIRSIIRLHFGCDLFRAQVCLFGLVM